MQRWARWWALPAARGPRRLRRPVDLPLLVMQDVGGGPIGLRAERRRARREAARQLLESFYQQIMVEGFFHADPHPGA